MLFSSLYIRNGIIYTGIFTRIEIHNFIFALKLITLFASNVNHFLKLINDLLLIVISKKLFKNIRME